VQLNQRQGAIDSIAIQARSISSGGESASQAIRTLKADHFIIACGSYSAPLLRTVGVDLPIYPGKGYSASFKIKRPEAAPMVSTIDDEMKIAISRLGDRLRVAGTIEVGGYDLTLNSRVARARCQMLSDRIEAVLPGVCDTRNEEQGGDPQYWTGLRPATPTNIPYIGQTKLQKLWVNAGHGTLGWTHGAGSGKALAELINGQKPVMQFKFLGVN
jgi:D-amino-acid dehydrogenase